MKLKKLTGWSGRRKGKSLSPKKKNPLRVHDGAEKCENLSARHESGPAIEEKNIGNETIPMKRQTGVLTSMVDHRPCFLFEDNDDDNVNNDGNNECNKKNHIAANPGLKCSQIPKREIPNPIALPQNDNLATSPIASPSKPPFEIMVDHLAVPPSPMREPNVNVITSPSMGKRLLDDYNPGIFLNFKGGSPPREIPPHNPCFGDPVGDIAMHRQLMDAQRLVRIILGKPLSKSKEILDANSILQAIRSYALMKAELVALRKKQEVIDGDPPAILQTLGSPAATTPSTTRTGPFFGGRTTGLLIDDDNDERNNSDSACESMGHQSAQNNADRDSPDISALEQSNEMVRRLQAELEKANRTIAELKDNAKGGEGENDGQNHTESIRQVKPSERTQDDQERDKLRVEGTQKEENPEQQEEIELGVDNHLIESDKQIEEIGREESKQDGSLDLLLNEILLIPQRGLTKDKVREKLELCYHRIAQDSSANQILEMKEHMRQFREESDRRMLEMENKLKEQEEDHKKQLREMSLNKEHSVDLITEQSPISVLKELSFEHKWDH